jgi:hypothetical protein
LNANSNPDFITWISSGSYGILLSVEKISDLIAYQPLFFMLLINCLTALNGLIFAAAGTLVTMHNITSYRVAQHSAENRTNTLIRLIVAHGIADGASYDRAQYHWSIRAIVTSTPIDHRLLFPALFLRG